MGPIARQNLSHRNRGVGQSSALPPSIPSSPVAVLLRSGNTDYRDPSFTSRPSSTLLPPRVHPSISLTLNTAITRFPFIPRRFSQSHCFRFKKNSHLLKFPLSTRPSEEEKPICRESHHVHEKDRRYGFEKGTNSNPIFVFSVSPIFKCTDLFRLQRSVRFSTYWSVLGKSNRFWWNVDDLVVKHDLEIRLFDAWAYFIRISLFFWWRCWYRYLFMNHDPSMVHRRMIQSISGMEMNGRVWVYTQRFDLFLLLYCERSVVLEVMDLQWLVDGSVL